MSDEITKRFNDALAALNSKDLKRAEKLFRRVIEIDTSHVPALNLLAIVLMSMERFDDAEQFIERATSLNQKSDVSFYNYGLISKQLNKPRQALENFSKALTLNPNVPETWNNRGTIFNDLKDYDLAIADFDKAISSNGLYSEAYANKGKSLTLLKRYKEALAAYDKALSIKPDLAEVWLGRGNVFAHLKRYDEAFSAYDKALSIKPDLAEAWLGRGNVFTDLKRYDEAFAAYDKALSIKHDLDDAWLGRGNVFTDLKRYDEAFAAYDKALSIKPDLENAWLGRGNVFTHLKRDDEAFAAYDKALSIKPDLAEVWLGRGNVFTDLKRYDEAFAAYDKALSIKPDLENAWLGRGNVFTDLKRYDEAFAAYDKALSIKPDLENAWLGRGNVFTHLKRYDEAFAAYDKALSIKPDLAEAWLGRGNAFTDLRRYEEAFAAYDRAFALNCDLIGVEGSRLYAKLHCCLWSDLGADAAKLITSIRLGKENSPPLCALCIDASPDDQLRCADSWVKKNIGNVERQKVNTVVGAADKIRLGYLSADLRAHPVGYLAAGLFESHNRDRFETYAFSIGPNDNSDLRNRIEKSFYKFVDLNNRTDDEISTAIRSAKIDILVDLMGHTYGSRPAVLARHPAPILVNYLGFAGTTGGDLSDYIIVDKTVVDDSNKEYFSEKMAFLPHCFLPHDEKGRTISDKLFTRQDQGLPEEGFVFCCFNSAYKINPNVFTRWMNILKKVDGAVLWLSGLNETAKKNLRQEAEERGVGSNRLVFSKHLALPADHLARQCLADLFLDTLPYNAHTTASDALWAGVPVLTQIGDTFAGRVATSLLNAVGLPELITRSPEEYEALAVALALDRENLQNIRKKLGKNRLTTPLFDTPLYARHLELVYEAMYRRNKSGLPPDHIEIQPLTADFRGG